MPGGTLEIVADKVEWEGDTEGGRYHLVKLILQPNIAQQNRKLQMKISENVKFRCSQLFSCKHLTFRDVNMFQYYQYTLRSNNTEMFVVLFQFSCCEHSQGSILCFPFDEGIEKTPWFSFQFWCSVFHLVFLHYQRLKVLQSVGSQNSKFLSVSLTDLSSVLQKQIQLPPSHWRRQSLPNKLMELFFISFQTSNSPLKVF